MALYGIGGLLGLEETEIIGTSSIRDPSSSLTMLEDRLMTSFGLRPKLNSIRSRSSFEIKGCLKSKFNIRQKNS